MKCFLKFFTFPNFLVGTIPQNDINVFITEQ
jgi:hypothetical protein